MEVVKEDIVIVGAGIAGLATSLGLHRLGFRSLVLESSESLRIAGFALSVWSNAWRALDALNVGDTLRLRSSHILGYHFTSLEKGLPPSQLSLRQFSGKHEVRYLKRRELLEIMAKELPQGTIRFSSKVVSIEESGHFKLVHLADGCVIQAKLLIGCDGVNSAVGKWLGLPTPVTTERSAVRGFVEYPDDAHHHNFQPHIHAYFGGGIRFGFVPLDQKSIYWFCTVTSSTSNWNEDIVRSPAKFKDFVLSKITSSVPDEVLDIVRKTNLDSLTCGNLRMRMPWDILLRDVAKGNVCVAGDALHPMVPDIGQGGCSSLEDGVVLARCIAESFKNILSKREALKKGKEEGIDDDDGDGDEEMVAIYKAVEKYTRSRKWRSFSLVATARVVGLIQESDNKLVRFLREKLLSKYTVAATLRMTEYDCGKLDAF